MVRLLRLRLARRPPRLADPPPARRGLDAAAGGAGVRARGGAVLESPPRRGLQRGSAVATAHPRQAPPSPVAAGAPEAYAAAFEAVQEHLHAGNSYEVNLTHRLTREADLDPVTAYLRLRELNPAPYSGFLQHDVAEARAWLLSSSPERYAAHHARPAPGDQADQGHDPARRQRRGRRRPPRATGHRPQDPRREPDDRRPAPQRPVPGLRRRVGRGAVADAGRDLRVGAPARLHGAGPPARRRHDGRLRCARCSPRVR